MEIAFSHDAFLTQRFGGVSRYVAELHRGLRERGVRSFVLAGLHVNEHLASLPGVIGARLPSTRGSRLRARLAAGLEALWLSWRGSSTILHKTYYCAGQQVAGVRVAVTVHDMIHERFAALFAPGDPTSVRKRYWCERADVIFVVSESTRRDLLELFQLTPAKVVVTPLGVQMPSRPPMDNPRLRHGDYFLFVGSRWGYKNFSRLLEAFALLPAVQGMQLVCFGGGGPSPEELEQIQTRGLGEQLAFVGGSDEQLRAYYAGATALVCPSLYEGFGIPPLEAMAQGCPVLCADAASLPEVVGSAGVLFDPHDPAAIAEALLRILEEKGLREQLARAGRERASSFSWERTVQRTLEGYARLGR